MKYDIEPPLETRTDEELLKMVFFSDKWNPEVVEDARTLLTLRGIDFENSIKQLVESEKYSTWLKEQQKQERASESYGTFELVMMVFKFPISLLSLITEHSLKKDGFIKKYRQRKIIFLIMTTLWTAVFLPLSLDKILPWQVSQQNEVNRQDIYEWEKDYYTDQEFILIRQEAIEEAINTVRENMNNDLLTIVSIDSSMVNNDNIDTLRTLNPLLIRNIWTEEELFPRKVTISIIMVKK